MKVKLTIFFSILFFLAIIIFIALDLHINNEEEMISLFRENQLFIANQGSKLIEARLNDFTVELNHIARYSAKHNSNETGIFASFEYLQIKDSTVSALSVYRKDGSIVYSAGENNHFDDSRVLELIAANDDIFLYNVPDIDSLNHINTFIVYPVKDKQASIGLMILSLDLDMLIKYQFSFISNNRLKQAAWVIDKNGVLLFSSSHPSMVTRNITDFRKECLSCHSKISYYTALFSSEKGILDYETSKAGRKLAFFAPIHFKNTEWKLVANISYDEITRFSEKSLQQTILLIGVAFTSLLISFSLLYYNYKLKVRAEEETKQFKEKEALREELLHSAEKISAMNEELKSIIESRDKFFAVMAHDLRSPFHGMLSYTEFLHDDYDSLPEEERKNYIGHLNKIAHGTYKLLENLLEWSAIQTGKVSFEPKEIALYSSLEHTIELLKESAKKKNITLISLIDHQMTIFADINMISAIIRNLVSNSIKFTHPGGEVTICAVNYKKYVEFTVMDNGIGMEEAVVKEIFKTDRKNSTKGTLNEEGSGLGLLLCQEMVHLHKGHIFCSSQQGKGTKFTFIIPGKQL